MKLKPFARTLSVTYSSGLTLSGSELSALATYYDEVWFPYPFNWDPDADVVFRPIGDQPAFHDLIARCQEDYTQWRHRNALLFREGILKVLPLPYKKEDGLGSGELAKEVASLTASEEPGVMGSLAVISGVAALAVHILAGATRTPQIFLQGSGIRKGQFSTWDNWLRDFVATFWRSSAESKIVKPHSREEVSAQLIRSLFQLSLPSLPPMGAEEILDLRVKLRPFRAGFTEYVISMTGEIETQIGNGKTLEEAANAIADRKVIGEANQFIRRYEKPLWTVTKDAVGESGGVFKLVAPMTTGSFWATLLPPLFKVVGAVLKGHDARACDMAQNSSQAYAYLGTLWGYEGPARSQETAIPEGMRNSPPFP